MMKLWGTDTLFRKAPVCLNLISTSFYAHLTYEYPTAKTASTEKAISHVIWQFKCKGDLSVNFQTR